MNVRFKRNRKEVCETLNGGITDFPSSEILSVFYKTTPEAIKEILPPGLLPYKQPIVMAGFNNFKKTNFEVPYWETALYVSAVHEHTGQRGFFVPAMTLNVDMGTILGREVGGYPKKCGNLKLERKGPQVEGSAERHGIQYFTIKANLSGTPNNPDFLKEIAEIITPPDEENHPGATIIFNYLWPASTWVHYENINLAPKPILYTVWKSKQASETKPEIGSGEIIFQESKHDPWCALPVVETLGAIMTYDGIALDGSRSPENEYPVDAQEYLPYAFYGFDAILDE